MKLDYEAMGTEQALLWGSMYKSLRDQGLNEAVALHMVTTVMVTMLPGGAGKSAVSDAALDALLAFGGRTKT